MPSVHVHGHANGKPMSLVEQKRIQWAKEREEMVGLCGLWGSDQARVRADHIGVPARRAHLLETCTEEVVKSSVQSSVQQSSVQSTMHSVHVTLQRRPSLPPIKRPSFQAQEDTGAGADQGNRLYGGAVHYPTGYHQNGYPAGYPVGYPAVYTEEESSGYASDSAGGHEQVLWEDSHQGQQQVHRHVAPTATTDWQERPGVQPVSSQCPERRYVIRGGWTSQQAAERNDRGSDAPRSTGTSGSGSGSSVSSASWADEAGLAARARWGDRGVGVGHLWEPCEDSDADGPPRLPPVTARAGAPAWLHRGLRGADGNRDSEVTSQVLVVSHPDTPGELGSPPSTGEHDDNPCRSFLRGQNVPLEADILEERQRRRAKALEHQSAVRKQLEERDRRRKEERERRMREERLEEERVHREQEQERRRVEQEQRQQREREEQEARRAAAMLEALQAAEREAKEQKLRQSRKHVAEAVEGKTGPSPRASPRASPKASPRTSPRASPRKTPPRASPRASPRLAAQPGSDSAGPNQPSAPRPPSPVSQPPDATALSPTAVRGPDGAAELADRLSSLHVAESAVAAQDGERKRNPDDGSPELHQDLANNNKVLPTGVLGDPATGWFPVLEFLQPPHEFKSGGPPLLPLGDGLALVLPPGSLSSSRDSAHDGTPGYPLGSGPRVISTPQHMAVLMSPLSMAAAEHAALGPRLLTPTKFRRRLREAATQTSAGLRRRGAGVNSGSSRTRMGRVSHVPLGERPKWGVNRPGTMYRTQSEKDPNYHQQRLQRLQRLHQRMIRQLRADANSTNSNSSGGGGGAGVQLGELDGSRSASSSPRGSPGSGDVLSRTYRICRGEHRDAALGTAMGSTSTSSRRQPAAARVPAPRQGRQELRNGRNDHLSRISTASTPGTTGMETPPTPPSQRSLRRVAAGSRPGRYSVREDSGSSGSVGGSGGGSPEEENDPEAGEDYPGEDDLLTRLSSLRQGLLLRREQLIETASPS